MAYIRKKSYINTAKSFNVNRWICSTREKVLGVGEGGERMAGHQKYTNQSKCRTIDVGSFTETI